MALVIDGYNLLHASGILGRGIGPGSLERSRNALLNFLAESLDAQDLPRTTIVFDARQSPPGLPRISKHRGITVRFAEHGGDADQVIEDLIRANSSPKRLVVVSSDHRLHRAARRRKARPIDSDQWYVQVLRRRIERVQHQSSGLKPDGLSSDVEVHFWLRQFGLEEAPEETATEAAAGRSPAQSAESLSDAAEQPLDNPFPPGYAEDVTDEDL